MVQCLFDGDVLQVLSRPAEEGTAGGREKDAFEPPLGRCALEALEDGGVLTVDGQDLHAVFLRRRSDQLAAGDEGLLVGKGDGLPRFDGIHGGQEPGDADDGVEDRVRVRVGGTFTDPADAGQYFRVRVGDADPEVGSRRFVEKSDLVRVELPDLLFHGLHTGAGGQGADTDAVLAGDVQALGADGTGGTEDGEVFRHTAPTTIP